MDLLDQIIRFLKEQNLESSVKEIENERKNTKKPLELETQLNSAISEYFPNTSHSETLDTMQKFIRKIEKKPIIRPVLPSKRPKPSQKKLELLIPETFPTNQSHSTNSQSEFKPISLNQSINDPQYTNPQTQASLLLYEEEELKQDEIKSDTDEDFLIIECKAEELKEKLLQVAENHSEILTAKPKQSSKKREENLSQPSESLLPAHAKFPQSSDAFYPTESESVMLDCFSLKVVFDRYRTGFMDSKDFTVNTAELIAGRYKVVTFLPSGTFSKVLFCIDVVSNEKVCLKIIENSKEATDSSIDEVKVLRFLAANGDLDTKNIVRYKDCLYHNEHLIIVTELLRDNIQAFLSHNEKNRRFFTMGHIQKLAFQMLTALEFIHSLQLIHADVKPENILIKSFRQGSFKLIDFGSARFVHDELSNYAQCRKYRAPEVILGFHYDCKVDLWSLGCVLFEVFTGKALFDCSTVQEFLAKVIGMLGQFPEDVYKFGINCKKYFTKEKVIFLELDEKMNFESLRAGWKGKKKYKLFIPKKSSLKKKMKCDDLAFVDFIRSLLTPDRYSRPSAAEALNHPFISENRYVDGIECFSN